MAKAQVGETTCRFTAHNEGEGERDGPDPDADGASE